MIRSLTTAVLAAGLALPSTASACGGFFCDNNTPIDQKAEDVVFEVDAEANTTTVHVGITYQGASEDFAWIVPVPAEPELSVGSDAMISALVSATAPRVQLLREERGICRIRAWSSDFDIAVDSDEAGWDVDVLGEEQVGPYDAVTLRAESTSELLGWLNEAGYDLPSDLETVLAPYVAGGQYFVALKLSAGSDTGDLRPLTMTYAGTTPAVPIQLTSVAATPDMRLRVHVFGDTRAVPDNYLHVTLNEASLDWLNGGQNYSEVVSVAADEAGGQAFATDYSGSTDILAGAIFAPSQASVEGLRGATGPEMWVDGVFSLGMPPGGDLLSALRTIIPYPPELAFQGVSPQDFYNCLGCYSQYIDAESFDADVATDQLQEQLIDGLRDAVDLFARSPHVTRLISSMDAAEMTVDPMFTFNGDLEQEVSNVHTATLVTRCGLFEGDGAERVLELSDGRRIPLPSTNWQASNDADYFDMIGELASPAALLIEDYSATGQGEVVFDFREEAADEARRFNRAGCSCDSGAAPTGALLLLGLAGLLRRRRT